MSAVSGHPLLRSARSATVASRLRVAPKSSEPGTDYCRLFSRDWWLISAAAFALMFQSSGDLGVLLFLGSCFWLVKRNMMGSLYALLRYSPLLLLPALTLLSTLWSDNPSVSLKQGAEFAMTAVGAIVIGRRIAGRELAVGLLFGAFLLGALSLVSQHNLSVPLVGVFGSKNQMAFMAQVLLLSGLATASDTSLPRRVQLFALAGLGLGLLEVVLARSAGTWVTSAAAAAAFIAFRYFSHLSIVTRVSMVALVVVATTPLAVAYQDVEEAAQTFQTDVLHKDATLTGRIQLWTSAGHVIEQRPLLGHGYSAFWQQGNLDAEGLYRANGVASRTGFNFHNQFLDVCVDLGEVGLAVLVVSLAVIGFASLFRAIKHPSISAAFITTILLTLYMRLPVESTLLGPWNVYTMLWIVGGIQAFAPIATQVGRDGQSSPRRSATTLRPRAYSGIRRAAAPR